ncbi:MAG: D-alanine--D-alanine ligase [Candidatus Fermentithermobacillus carboniphilus]|uniref:D-alanine--D-alanine ligase n=1 Tax=Candidatus Fermentithermobacillus carboniphilus TaxID=3085328 RepID=A0AAT9LG73_9FIRM|nr:MAG: D-alanine--D-alanine ligase [Candidatus Fermentithermobacillus carboniphilus]
MAVVGVMYNLKGEPPDDGEPPDSGAELDSESTVLAVAEALRAYGHEVCLIEGNDTAYLKLLSGHLDIVFNMCEGLRGESRESHIPAILEMLGIPYTGSGVLTLAITLDKPLTKKILAYHGIPTAKFKVFTSESEIDTQGLEFPLFVKPAHEGSSMGISPSSLCRDPLELYREVRRVAHLYKQPVLVEEYLPGREFTVGILGNKNPEIFPVMEINFSAVPRDHGSIYSRQFKVEWYEDRYYLCPAPISAEMEEMLKDIALRTYRVLDCRDLARIDLRLDKNGVPNVMEVNPLPGMAPGFSDYPRIAEKGGWTYTELVNGILECALRRYGLSHLSSSAFVKKQIA